MILHGKTFLKVNAREWRNDMIGTLVPNDTAASERRACPIARLIKTFPLFTWHDKKQRRVSRRKILSLIVYFDRPGECGPEKDCCR